MDLQNEAIELQKVFHQDYKTYWEETEAIKAHLEARFKALGLFSVVGQGEQFFCNNERMGVRCVEQCLGCFQFENKD